MLMFEVTKYADYSSISIIINLGNLSDYYSKYPLMKMFN